MQVIKVWGNQGMLITWCKHGQQLRKNVAQSSVSNLSQALQQQPEESLEPRVKQNQWQTLCFPIAVQLLGYQPEYKQTKLRKRFLT